MEGKVLILVAERDPYSAELTEHFLRSEGYDVLLTFSAEEALAASRIRRPALSIVDLLLSGAQGKRLCSQLLEGSPNPVVAMSSLASAEAAYSVGASAFLQKPIEPLELITTVHDLLAPTHIITDGGEAGHT